MRKKSKILILVIILVLVSGVIFYSKLGKKEKVSPLSTLSYEYKSEASESVYDFMEQLKNENEITFEEKTYSGMGKFIDSINGIKNNGEKNWIYYVNNKKANVGVSNYQINKGDIVSWRYEKSY